MKGKNESVEYKNKYKIRKWG